MDSDTLIVDFEPILNWMLSSKICRTKNWRRIALGAQAAVMATVGGFFREFRGSWYRAGGSGFRVLLLNID
jgi:hypothetical protein